jgi:hypothetical protein
MTVCAVINNETNEVVNTIVAEPTDRVPEGFKLVEIPEGYFWDGTAVVQVETEEVLDGN